MSGGRSLRRERRTASSAVSTCSRSSAAVIRTCLCAEIAQLEYAVGSLYQLLHSRFGLVELARGESEELDSFLEKPESGVEVEPVAFELRDDLFEPGEIVFKLHC